MFPSSLLQSAVKHIWILITSRLPRPKPWTSHPALKWFNKRGCLKERLSCPVLRLPHFLSRWFFQWNQYHPAECSSLGFICLLCTDNYCPLFGFAGDNIGWADLLFGRPPQDAKASETTPRECCKCLCVYSICVYMLECVYSKCSLLACVCLCRHLSDENRCMMFWKYIESLAVSINLF